MIDHVLNFATEQAAIAALPAYYVSNAWDQSKTYPNQTVTLIPAVWDNTDPLYPVLITPAVTLPGFWISISLSELDQKLIDLPNYALRFATNRDLSRPGTNKYVYLAPDLNKVQLVTGKIEPVPAGATY